MGRNRSGPLARGFSGCQMLREPQELGVDIFSEIFEDIFGYFEEHGHDGWIELPSRPEFDLLASGSKRLGGAVGAVGAHRVEGVGNRENPCSERDFIVLEAARIT